MSGKHPSLVIIGYCALDDVRTRDFHRSGQPGGAVYNSVLGASLFSKDVGVCSVVGTDYDMEHVTRLGINTKGIRVIEGKTPKFYLDYTDPENRTIEGDLGVAHLLCPDCLPPEYLHSSIIHVSTMKPEQQAAFIDHLRDQSYRGLIAVDTNIEEHITGDPNGVLRVLTSSDLIFLNRREYGELRSIGLDLTGKQVVVKEGKDGARYMSEGNEISFPAPRVKCIDPTGAGDVFAGVFLTFLVRGDSELALRKAVETASRSVEFYGVDGLLDTHLTRTLP